MDTNSSISQDCFCIHCQTCSRRSDWEFLGSFFEHDQLRIDEINRLQSQHAEETQTLNLHIAALHVANTSTTAFLADTQAQFQGLSVDFHQLQARNATLTESWSDAQQKYQELEICYQAVRDASDRQALELQHKELELSAVIDSAKEIGNMLNSLVSAEDFHSEAMLTHLTIAELVLRTKYQALEIQDLKAQMTQEHRATPSSPPSMVQWDGTTCQECPSPRTSSYSVPSQVNLIPVSQEKDFISLGFDEESGCDPNDDVNSV